MIFQAATPPRTPRIGVVPLVAIALGLWSTWWPIDARAGDGEGRELPRFALDAGNHTVPLDAVAASGDGALVATAAHDGTVRVWRAADGQLLETHWLPDAVDAPPIVRLRFDGEALLLDTRSVARRLDRARGAITVRTGGAVGRGDVDGAGRAVILVRRDGIDARPPDAIRLIGADGKVLAERVAEPDAVPASARFSPDGSLVVVGWLDIARLDVLDGRTLAPRYQPDLVGVTRGDLRAAAFTGDGRELVAGGTFSEGDGSGRVVLRRWTEAGRGAPRDLPIAADTITDLAPLGAAAIAVATAEPGWSVVDASGPPTVGAQLLLRGRRYRTLRVDETGDRVLLPPAPDGAAASFSVSRRAVLPLASPTADPALKPARISAPALSVLDWRDSRRVLVNGNKVELDQPSRSLAISPGASWFILGLDGMLHARVPQLGHFVENAWTPIPGSAWSVVFSGDGKLLVAALGDGTIRWYRASDNRELLALYAPADPSRWVLFTPAGFYDAAPGAESLVGWAVGRGERETASYYSIGRFRERFHRPDVIDRVLPALDVWRAVAAADDALQQARQSSESPAPSASQGPIRRQLPPLVTVLAPADGSSIARAGGAITVRARVRSQSGAQVSRLRVLVDGRQVAASRGIVTLGAPASPSVAAPGTAPAPTSEGGSAANDADLREIAITVPAGTADVTIAVVAESSSGQGDPAIVHLRRAAQAAGPADTPAAALRPRLYLLAVGVGAYPARELKLRYPAKDAADLAAAFGAQQGRLYRTVETRVLTERAATRAAVLDGLQWLQRSTTERDVAVLFLAGHGIDDPGGGQYFFLPVDADLGRPLASMVGDVQIREALAALAGKVVLLLDTCHAGGVVRGRSLRGGGGWTRFVNELASAENGVVVLAASTARQSSQEAPAWKNGAFTHAIVEGLRGAADYGKTGRITVDMLALYASERVKKLTGGTQTPSSAKPNTLPDFPIAVVK